MTGRSFLTTDPPNAEVSLAQLDGSPANQSSMYMRNNFRAPESAPESFIVALPGSPPRRLARSDLTGYNVIEDRIVLECAGNGRNLMRPVPEGTPWGLGGVSIIDVRGVRLADVLGDVPKSVREVVATGADSGTVEPEGTVNYQFSLPRELAVSESPLLVTHIGGEPLTIEHGAPVRLIVRGHYAMMSVKWLERLEGIPTEFKGHFVNKYRYFGDDSQPEGSRVGNVQPRSVIASPTEGETLSAGAVVVRGSAWTGLGEIETVAVAVNGGPWLETDIERPAGGLARWSIEMGLSPGNVMITSRATDSTGATQPPVSRWNENGYANNVQHQIEFAVV